MAGGGKKRKGNHRSGPMGKRWLSTGGSGVEKKAALDGARSTSGFSSPGASPGGEGGVISG